MENKYIATVILVNWNGKDFLEECLECLEKQSMNNFKIIIVDNNSSDGSLNFIREYKNKSKLKIELIENDKNYGFAYGNNQAIKVTDSEFIALLNNDAVPDKDWLKNLLNALKKNPECGFAASKIIFYKDRNKIYSAGDIFTKWGIGRTRGRFKSADDYSKKEYIFGACACAAIYRKELFEKVGLFDEDFFAYNEDIDISFRAQLAGYKCKYVPDAIVFHHGAATSRRFPAYRLYLSRRNIVYVYIKNMPSKLFKKYLLRFIIYILIGDLLYILKRKLVPVIKSRRDLIKNLPNLLRKRRTIQNRMNVIPEYIESLFRNE